MWPYAFKKANTHTYTHTHTNIVLFQCLKLCMMASYHAFLTQHLFEIYLCWFMSLWMIELLCSGSLWMYHSVFIFLLVVTSNNVTMDILAHVSFFTYGRVSLGRCSSIKVYRNHLSTSLKCKFWFSWSEVGLRMCISHKCSGNADSWTHTGFLDTARL